VKPATYEGDTLKLAVVKPSVYAGKPELAPLVGFSSCVGTRGDIQGFIQNKLVEEETVPAVTLSTLLEKHGLEKKVHVLAIDVNGMELEVLNQLDFGRNFPDVLIVRVVDLFVSEYDTIIAFLQRFRYDAIERDSGYIVAYRMPVASSAAP
jgi:hypothetical protein